jgi:glycine cleavage system regulatory protein
MKKHAILSAVGRDRVGVADDLGAALASRSLRIEDSRMTSLRGRFALLVQVGGDQDDVAKLKNDLGGLAENLGFELNLEPLKLPRSAGATPGMMIEAFSKNPQGLNAVTGLIKRHGINIEELQTEASTEPFASRTTFHMKLRLTMSATTSRDNLAEELRALEKERNLDIVIKDERVPVGI